MLTKLSCCLLAFLLSLAGGVAAKSANDMRLPRKPITSEYLYETCATVGETEAGLIPHFDCESYVYGVLDSHVAIRDGLPLRRRSCFPKDIQAWRVLNEIEADVLGKNGAGNAGDAIIRALVKRYPCQERSGKSK